MWRLFSLIDSAFPSGGFAHSGGLEAAHAHGEVPDAAALRGFVTQTMWQAGTWGLPFVRAGFATVDVAAVRALDARCEAALGGEVARRTSRTQGRAWLATVSEVYPAPRELADAARKRQLHAHFPVVFGATIAGLGPGAREVDTMWLYAAVRAVVSASVRLGIVGPHEGQRLQAAAGAELPAVLAACEGRGIDDAASSAPLLDVLAGLHDGLRARLFQS